MLAFQVTIQHSFDARLRDQKSPFDQALNFYRSNAIEKLIINHVSATASLLAKS